MPSPKNMVNTRQRTGFSRNQVKNKGFALIATISIMILLVMIALAMLTLSTVEVRSARHGNTMLQAQANARMAMMIAIGDLQKAMGPDQRVSASSALLDSNPASLEIDGMSQKHLTGVWESWKWQPGDINPDYDGIKDKSFVRWLTSHPDPDKLKARDYPESQVADPVLIVGQGSTTDPDGTVQASRIHLEKNQKGMTGSMAWAVFDEGQKARISLSDKPAISASAEITRLAAPPLPGFDALRDLDVLGSLKAGEHDKLVSLPSMRHLGIDAPDYAFHSLSAHTAHLMTDVTEGGFAKDLSLLFDQPSLPNTHAGKYLYSDKNTPIEAAPQRFNGANPMPSPDPQWKLLHSHYRLYDKVSQMSDDYLVDTSKNGRPLAGESTSAPFFNEQQLLPVVAKAQFVFSLSAGWHSHLNFTRGRTKQDKYVGWLMIDPVITLWNPYNVSLRFSQSEIQLYRVPLSFRIYKNGTMLSKGYTHFANTFFTSQMEDRKNAFYKLNLKPEYGSSEVILKPGEYKVFTAHSHVRHSGNQYHKIGVDLRPGFNPPEGNDSNKFVGGISSLHLMVDSKGLAYGARGARRVPLKAGDVLEVDVMPNKAEVDKFPETNNKEITSFMKFYQGTGDEKSLIGGVELDYTKEEIEKNLPTYAKDALSNFVVPGEIPKNVKADDYQGSRPPPNCRFKRPFLIASLQLKTEQDSRYPSRAWLQNGPTNTYASSGLEGDQTQSQHAQQYEFTWEPMTDWKDIPGIQLDTQDRGYGGSGLYSDTGTHYTPNTEIPLVPPTSMGQLRHAPLNNGGQLPLTTQVVANSFACPLLPRNSVSETGLIGSYLDHSFLANTRLFDHYFFSSATTQNTSFHSPKKTLPQVLTDFFQGTQLLPNSRFQAVIPAGSKPDKMAADLLASADPHTRIGSHLLLRGGFNVNSVSLEAWKLFLASGTDEAIPILDSLTSSMSNVSSTGTVVSRFVPPTGQDLGSEKDPAKRDILRWSGHRRLDEYQIADLAEAAIEQVKRRGPFQSVAEFVNRRLENSKLGLYGALQTAIEEADLNTIHDGFSPEIDAIGIPYADEEAANGRPSAGAPTSINQADLLTPLAPFLAVRSDTFRIRSYGEATDASGNVARAWCEAIVQRVPEYIDSNTSAETAPSALPVGSVNARFGRRMRVVSFRWLTADEI